MYLKGVCFRRGKEMGNSLGQSSSEVQIIWKHLQACIFFRVFWSHDYWSIPVSIHHISTNAFVPQVWWWAFLLLSFLGYIFEVLIHNSCTHECSSKVIISGDSLALFLHMFLNRQGIKNIWESGDQVINLRRLIGFYRGWWSDITSQSTEHFLVFSPLWW